MANRSLRGVLLHSRATPASLGLLRIWMFGVWLVYVLADPLHLLAFLPRDAFSAPGILGIVPEGLWTVLLSEAGLHVLRLVTLVGILIVILGLVPSRLLALSVTAMLILYQGVLRGFAGHMNHAELLLLYSTGIVAIFPCFDGLSFRKPRVREREKSLYTTPFVAIAFLFCLTFTFVGAARLGNGLGLFYTDTLRNLAIERWIQDGAIEGQRFVAPSTPIPGLGLIPDVLFRTSYLASTLLELLAPLALISRRFRYVFVGFAIAFHLANLLLLDVPFIENMFLLVVFSEKWFHDIAAFLDRAIRGSTLASVRKTSREQTTARGA
jgi:hypothetical protein